MQCFKVLSRATSRDLKGLETVGKGTGSSADGNSPNNSGKISQFEKQPLHVHIKLKSAWVSDVLKIKFEPRVKPGLMGFQSVDRQLVDLS